RKKWQGKAADKEFPTVDAWHVLLFQDWSAAPATEEMQRWPGALTSAIARTRCVERTEERTEERSSCSIAHVHLTGRGGRGRRLSSSDEKHCSEALRDLMETHRARDAATQIADLLVAQRRDTGPFRPVTIGMRCAGAIA